VRVRVCVYTRGTRTSLLVGDCCSCRDHKVFLEHGVELVFDHLSLSLRFQLKVAVFGRLPLLDLAVVPNLVPICAPPDACERP
jgi:hypothetical protein